MSESEKILQLEAKIAELQARLDESEKLRKIDYSNCSEKKSIPSADEIIDVESSNLQLTTNEKISQLEHALAETQSKLETILNSTDDIVWSLSYPDFSLIYINGSVDKIYGRSSVDFYADNNLWFQCIYDEDKDKVLKSIDRLQDTRKNEVTYRIVRSDGQIRYMLDKSTAITDINGKIVRIEGIARDITELMLANDEIDKSKKQYELIFESTSNGIIVFDAFGNVVAINSQACRLFDYKKSELLGKNGEFFISSENIGLFKKFMNELSIGNRFFNEAKEKRKNGSEFFVEIYGAGFVYERENLFVANFNDITKRKENELLLIDTKYKLNAILNNSNQSFTLIDKNYKLIAYNEKFSSEVRNRVGSDVFIGMSFLDIVPDYLLDHFVESFQKALLGEEVKSEQTLILPNSEKLIYSFSYNPVEDENGQITSVVLNSIDVTEIKHIEKEIVERNYFIESLIESIPMPVFYKDINGVYLGCNRALEESLGMSKSEIIGKTVYDISPDELAQKYDEMDQELFKSITKQVYEWEIKSKSGATKYVVFNKASFTNSDGFIAGLIGVIFDITDRKLIERKLIESQSELQAIYDSAPVLMCVVDDNLKIKNGNLAFMNYTGWPQHDVYKRKIGNIIGCINALQNPNGCGASQLCSTCKLRSAVLDTIATGESHDNLEIKTKVLKRNELIDEYFLVSTAGINMPSTNMTLVTLQIITEVKQLEEKQINLYEKLKISKDIIEANLYQKNALIDELQVSKSHLDIIIAEKDKFFSILAHDLRGPFSLLKNYIEKLIVEFSDLSPEDVAGLLFELKQSTDSVYKLLENLLDWSRVKTGKYVFEPVDIDLYEVAFNTVYVFSAIAKEKNINLYSNIKPENYITADYYMLSTVFRNLVSNALKFTNPGGFVRIDLIEHELDSKTFFEVVVEDSGIGMTPEQTQKLFHIDLSSTTLGTNNEVGTGLGLILCNEFLQKNGGFMRVESTPGIGSKFYFTIPV